MSYRSDAYGGRPRVDALGSHRRSISEMQAGDERAGGHSPIAREELRVGQMVFANRPWRLVRDLSKVLVATLASAGFFIINANAWGIADQLAVPILLLIALLAVSGLGIWLVVAHSLWEQPSQSRDRALTQRANAATALTLLVGLLFNYLVLYPVVLATMALVVPDHFMTTNLGHPAGVGDYAAAAWFAASMATVVGAIGSGLESDEEVHETISRYRPRLPDDSR
jgi:hypothetical protein